MKAVQITVTGKVQGVFFRATTKNVADQLKVRGFVRNENDGSVCIVAEGGTIFVDELITWCHQGPEKSKVVEVTVIEIAPKGYQCFTIVKKNPQQHL